MIVADDNPQAGAVARIVLRRLALKATGLTGADVERLVREARHKARRSRRDLTFSDLFDILLMAKPERPQALRWRMALHESGHAVARLALGLGRITAISIDSPDGGYTEGETPAMETETEAFFAGMLIVNLAGRAAEDELLGSVTAGSGGSPDSDLAKATVLAQAMETTLGFATEWPLLYRPASERSAFISDSAQLGKRVNARLEEAYVKARKLIRRNRGAAHVLAEALIRHETLEGEELEAALSAVRDRMVGTEVGGDSTGEDGPQ